MQREPTNNEADNSIALRLWEVTVRYGPVTALRQITFTARQGDLIAVVGPNGAGKSTLFNVVAGLVEPDSGIVHVYGDQPDGHICIGYVPQRNQIDWRFPVSVADVVMMGRVGRIGLFRWAGRADRRAVARALEAVGLTHLAGRQIGELSGGQQQRVFIARALAQDTHLLLLDEPFSGLDGPGQESILNILSELRKQSITMIVATHDLNRAASFFPLVLLLNRKIISFGPPADVLTSTNLIAAYGGHLHVVEDPDGDKTGTVVVADSGCGPGTYGRVAHAEHR